MAVVYTRRATSLDSCEKSCNPFHECKQTWKLISSPTLNASANIALDESLLESFDGTPLLRLYSWEPNSYTIGRFQKPEQIADIGRFGDDWARRMTGGGLLLHGFDLSYTVILPISYLGSKSVKESYEYICTFLINFYKELGLDVVYAKDCMTRPQTQSIFCQAGFEAYDMIYDGKKLGGNAQRRTKNILFQHGSIPLRYDSREYSGYSLEEFGITLSEDKAKELLIKSFQKSFAVILQ